MRLFQGVFGPYLMRFYQLLPFFIHIVSVIFINKQLGRASKYIGIALLVHVIQWALQGVDLCGHVSFSVGHWQRGLRRLRLVSYIHFIRIPVICLIALARIIKVVDCYWILRWAKAGLRLIDEMGIAVLCHFNIIVESEGVLQVMAGRVLQSLWCILLPVHSVVLFLMFDGGLRSYSRLVGLFRYLVG